MQGRRTDIDNELEYICPECGEVMDQPAPDYYECRCGEVVEQINLLEGLG